MKIIYSLFLLLLITTGCKTVTEKVIWLKKKPKNLEFLKKTESELKIEFGKPDAVEVMNNKNKILVYYDSKFKIKCEKI